MNRKYKKGWLIAQTAKKENRFGGGRDWCIPDRELAIRAGLATGQETKNQLRAILNAAYAGYHADRRKELRVGESFFTSKAWRGLRYKALVKFGARCQCCGISGADGAVMHVDHIKPRSKYPDLALELSNLQVLCADCNIGKSNRDQTDWRPLEAANDENMRHLRAIALEGEGGR